MLISVAVDQRSPRAAVCEHLEQARFLLLVETDQDQITKILACEGDGADLFCARATIGADCEAIICGDIAREAFALLADNMITRYYGWGADATQAVALMKDNRLQLIRSSREGDGCEGEEKWAELQKSQNAPSADC